MNWQIEELSRASKTRPDLVQSALDKMLQENPQLKRMLVISAYLDMKISLSKAAEELGFTRRELESQLQAEGIPVRDLTLEDVQAEAKAAKEW